MMGVYFCLFSGEVEFYDYLCLNLIYFFKFKILYQCNLFVEMLVRGGIMLLENYEMFGWRLCDQVGDYYIFLNMIFCNYIGGNLG